MDQEVKKLKKIANIMRKAGILHYKSGEFELSLSPQALFPKEPLEQAKEEKPVEIDPMRTLLWSAPGIEDAEESIN